MFSVSQLSYAYKYKKKKKKCDIDLNSSVVQTVVFNRNSLNFSLFSFFPKIEIYIWQVFIFKQNDSNKILIYG